MMRWARGDFIGLGIVIGLLAIAATIMAHPQEVNVSPQGGPQGQQGPTGPAPNIAIGTVTTRSAGTGATATVTGTNPNYSLNLGIPQGIQGVTGNTGPAPNMAIGTVSTLPTGSSATATITGTNPNYSLNLGLVTGLTGATGSTGPAGIVCYNSSGVVSGCKIWNGTATVDNSGNWSVSYSGVGFTTTPVVQASILSVSNSGVLTQKSMTVTSTGASGSVQGITTVLGVLALSLNNVSGSTLAIQAVGN